MAKVNGEGSVVPQVLAEIHDLRTEMRAYVEKMDQFALETRQTFGRMDQNLVRVGRLIVVLAEKVDNHEGRISDLERS